MATEREKEKGERTQLVSENCTANGAADNYVKGFFALQSALGPGFAQLH